MNGRAREREDENSKTLTLKDSCVRSIWTYLTASHYYTTITNTNKHAYATNIISMNKQLINAVSQSSYKHAETLEMRERVHVYIIMYTKANKKTCTT